jgi:hypothetical protein
LPSPKIDSDAHAKIQRGKVEFTGSTKSPGRPRESQLFGRGKQVLVDFFVSIHNLNGDFDVKSGKAVYQCTTQSLQMGIT